MISYMCFNSQLWKYSPSFVCHKMVKLANCDSFSLAWFVSYTSKQWTHQLSFLTILVGVIFLLDFLI